MLNFDNGPPEDTHQHSVPLIRTPRGGRLELIVTSSDMVGCKTHFVGNRTQPCETPTCDFCAKGYPWRWHGYVAAITHNDHVAVIFEMTAQAGEVLKNYREHHNRLRGCHIRAFRINSRPNGRVVIQTKPYDLTKITLPPPPNVEACLCYIWGISYTEDITLGRGRHGPQVHVDPKPGGENGSRI